MVFNRWPYLTVLPSLRAKYSCIHRLLQGIG